MSSQLVIKVVLVDEGLAGLYPSIEDIRKAADEWADSLSRKYMVDVVSVEVDSE